LVHTLAVGLVGVGVVSCRSQDFFKREVRRLEGRDEQYLAREYGAAVYDHEYSVAQLVDSPEPWRAANIRTLALYPPSAPENRQVRVRAVSWQRERILVTAWLHRQDGRWVAYYVEEWNMDVLE
jgi:hypothetical protein